jgi:hypothetical protein
MRPLFLIILLASAATARADTIITVSIDADHVQAALQSLVPRVEEPVGMVARIKDPELGLEKDDIVRTVQGESAFGFSYLKSVNVLYLEVVRGKKPIVIRAVLTRSPRRTVTVERAYLGRLIERLHRSDADSSTTVSNVTKDGKPSGVMVREAYFMDYAMHDQIARGDVIRAIDGKPVASVAELAAAFEAARGHDDIAVQLDRVGSTATVVLHLVGEIEPARSKAEADSTDASESANPPPVKGIKKVNDTSFEIDRSVLEPLRTNPTDLAKGARAVPAIKDGKPDGFKLYAIRPGSLYAALGFMNGDTVESINGLALTDADSALQAYQKLRDVKSLAVVVVRRGKMMTLSYTIK